MGRVRFLFFAILLGLMGALVPVSAPALSLPQTLAANRAIGSLHGTSWVLRPSFGVGYLGVSWLRGRAPRVRFEVNGAWSGWQRVEADLDLATDRARTYGELIPGDDADAYQLSGSAVGVRAAVINTTDGPRHVTWITPTAQATQAEPNIISRAQWGADESYRFDSAGNEVWPPAFYPTQKLTVHHTAGQNDDPNPAATVRAIYYYHAVTRGYGDIGYQFLIDAQGNVYKGRWSGPANDRNQADDTITGENAQSYGVTAAHVGGYNSGNIGIAVLGTYDTVDVSPAAKTSLVNMLAWESEHHGIDPQASSTYTNPINGTQKFTANISGHRDWEATDCPGTLLYGDLPSIRDAVAAQIAAGNPSPSPSPSPVATVPGAPSLSAVPATSKGVQLTWAAPSNGGSAITGYRIYRSKSAGAETLLTSVGAVTGYRDSGTQRGRVYYYEVTAVNSAGEGSKSNEAAARAS